jgi:hypothetical protein
MTTEKVLENAAMTPVNKVLTGTLPADYRTEYLGKRPSN